MAPCKKNRRSISNRVSAKALSSYNADFAIIVSAYCVLSNFHGVVWPNTLLYVHQGKSKVSVPKLAAPTVLKASLKILKCPFHRQ